VSQKLIDFFAQLKPRDHQLATPLLCDKEEHCVELHLLYKSFEQTVIQGLASDKVYCTYNNRQHILKNVLVMYA